MHTQTHKEKKYNLPGAIQRARKFQVDLEVDPIITTHQRQKKNTGEEDASSTICVRMMFQPYFGVALGRNEKYDINHARVDKKNAMHYWPNNGWIYIQNAKNQTKCNIKLHTTLFSTTGW